MENEEMVKSMFSFDETSDEHKIVEEILSDVNLDKKTELSQPLRWSILFQIKLLCQNWNLNKSQDILDNFINTSFRYLISKDRKGRLEYIESLKALKSLEKEKVENYSLMKR